MVIGPCNPGFFRRINKALQFMKRMDLEWLVIGKELGKWEMFGGTIFSWKDGAQRLELIDDQSNQDNRPIILTKDLKYTNTINGNK